MIKIRETKKILGFNLNKIFPNLFKVNKKSYKRSKKNPWEKIFKRRVPYDLQVPIVDFRRIVQLLKNNKAKKILDVAMGSGRHSLALASEGFQMYGFDLSESALEITINSLKNSHYEGHFRLGDMFEIYPYKTNFFDAVIAIQAIYHGYKDDMQRAIDESARVLKNDGLFIFNTSRDKKRPALGGDEDKIAEIDSDTYLPLEGREKGLVHYYPDKNRLKEMLSQYFYDITIKDDKIHKYFLVICRKKDKGIL